MRSGAYREPMVQGLLEIDGKLAELFRQGAVRLAIAGSIVGPVTVRRDLTEVCIQALERAGDQYAEEKAYYIDGLRSGRTVPVLAAGVDYIATGNSAEDAIKNQKAVLKKVPERTYAPGELFMKG